MMPNYEYAVAQKQIQKLHLFNQCHMIILFTTSKTLWIDCLSIVSFRYQNSLKPMFEVSSLRANTRLQTLSPLVDSSMTTPCCRVQTTPNVNQSLLEFVEIVDLHLVHPLLRDFRNLKINGVLVRTVRGP